MMSYEWRHAFTRIQVEYIEMPDLKLTVTQIRRLCDLPEELCEAAVAALLQVGFLWRAPDGRFVRRALGRAGREIDESSVVPPLDPPVVSEPLDANSSVTEGSGL